MIRDVANQEEGSEPDCGCHADAMDKNLSIADRDKADDQEDRGKRIDAADHMRDHLGPGPKVDFGSNSQEDRHNDRNRNGNDVDQHNTPFVSQLGFRAYVGVIGHG